MICDEVKVYLAFQVAQFIFQYFLMGKEFFVKTFKISSILILAGWIGLLILLCSKGYRRFTWWYVAISISLGVIFNIILLFSPKLRASLKKSQALRMEE